MKRFILSGSISRFLPQIFCAPDAGGGDGGGDAGAGAAAGGSNGDPAGAAEFDGFAPPALDASQVMGEEGDPAAAKGGDPKAPDPKAPDPKAKAGDKPPVKPKGAPQPKAEDGTPAALRAELDTLKKEKQAWEEKSKTEDPRIAQHKTEAETFKTKAADLEKKIADYERERLLRDPAVTGKLREFDMEYQKKAGKFYSAVPAMDQSRIHQLTVEYSKLPFNSENFKTAHAEFEAKVNLALGGSEEKEHSKLEKTMDFIRDNLESGRQRPLIEKEIQDNAKKLHFDAESSSYQTTKKNVGELLTKALTVPEGMDDPMHPKVALSLFDSALKPEQVEAFDKDIKAFVELVFAGPAPRSEQDFAGMKPDEIEAIRQGEVTRARVAREHAVDCLANGLRVLRRFPSVLKELARLRAKVGEEVDTPDPDAGAGSGGGGDGDGGDSLTNFTGRDLRTAAAGQF